MNGCKNTASFDSRQNTINLLDDDDDDDHDADNDNDDDDDDVMMTPSF